jgi:hypothetical protein
LPYNLEGIYREIIRSFNNKIYILCAGGLRALLEGICKDKEIDGHNLFEKINNLKSIKTQNEAGQIEGSVIGSKHAEILHNHRAFGNDALHDLKVPNPTDLKLLIEIIEHTIENIYELDYKNFELSRNKN